MLTNIRDEERHLFCPSDIFPQLLDGKMNHINDRFYQLRNKEEALAYWNNPILSRDLVILATAMLDSSKGLGSMVGKDYERVWGCMTLFYLLGEEPVFKQVLDKFFDGKLDEYTVRKLNEA